MSQREDNLEELDYKTTSKIERILDSAYDLFSARGIEDVSMSDIANKAKVSEDDLYTYFKTKQILVVGAATQSWTQKTEEFIPPLLKPKFKMMKGADQLKEIFALFVKLYEKHSDFLRFVYLFDAYAIKEKIPKESMANYEAKILLVKQIISDAIQKGISDGTINQKFLNYGELLYFTLMHTFFSAAQKLALSGKMLDMDSQMNGILQLRLLSDLMLDSLK